MAKSLPDGLVKGADGKVRCWWPGEDPLYRLYHDREWGRPVNDDIRLFEKICLEGFQAGLSWITILRRRENFRKVFAGFNPEKVARFTKKDVERLLKDEGIIRHRGKIEAAISNAQHAGALIEEFGSLGGYFWRFAPPHPPLPPSGGGQGRGPKSKKDIPAVTPESQALSKDLKKRGFRFVGPTTMYAHMQAMGMVNDHLEGCHCRSIIEKEQRAFKRPA